MKLLKKITHAKIASKKIRSPFGKFKKAKSTELVVETEQDGDPIMEDREDANEARGGGTSPGSRSSDHASDADGERYTTDMSGDSDVDAETEDVDSIVTEPTNEASHAVDETLSTVKEEPSEEEDEEKKVKKVDDEKLAGVKVPVDEIRAKSSPSLDDTTLGVNDNDTLMTGYTSSYPAAPFCGLRSCFSGN